MLSKLELNKTQITQQSITLRLSTYGTLITLHCVGSLMNNLHVGVMPKLWQHFIHKLVTKLWRTLTCLVISYFIIFDLCNDISEYLQAMPEVCCLFLMSVFLSFANRLCYQYM